MNTFNSIDEIKQVKVIPGFIAQFIHSKSMTVSYWEVKKGAKLPEHKHVHEQISQVIEGKFELTVDGHAQLMEPGKVAIISSNILHSGVAISNCKIMDIFSPVREDYKV